MKWTVGFTLQNGSSTTGLATLTDQASGFQYSGQLDISYPAAVAAFLTQAVAAQKAYVANLAAQAKALDVLQNAIAAFQG